MFTVAIGSLSDGAYSIGCNVKYALDETAQKIKDVASSPLFQGVVMFGLGAASYKIYMPLTEKIVKFLGVSAIPPDPFLNLHILDKIVMTPFVCVIGPIYEEIIFRGGLQNLLKEGFQNFYLNIGFSDQTANLTARITAVFFSSLIFGAIHFVNALVFMCNPVLFLPQVVAATLMGVMFGLAKEFSGELYLPIAMHIGNNTLAWANIIKPFL